MNEISEFEKFIYNCYLKYSRFGQPFKPRKDFDSFDRNLLAYLKKISYFLSRYTHIDVDEYFKSFCYIHPDEKYPPLDFFYTRLALKTFSLYKKQQENRDPEKQFEEIKNGFRFIGNFCIENKINIDRYLFHKTSYMYSWLNHYREHRISPYCLMELGNIIQMLDNLQKDEVSLFANNINNTFVAFKTRYMNSQKTISLVKEATQKIDNFVKKQLTK
jgi:hypothetical protein